MSGEQFAGVLRAILAALAGYVAGKGLLPSAMVDQLVGAGVTIGVAVWSIWSKKPAPPAA